MEFVPNIKPKNISKKTKANCNLIRPYPELKDKKIIGYFNGYSIDVVNHDDIIILYNNGSYGKGSQSRSTPHIVNPWNQSSVKQNFQDETLVLDLEESFFLHYIVRVLEVYSIFDDKKINSNELLEKFVQIKENFFETFLAYLYLKSQNWIIKTGVKFGSEFVIYKKGMHLYHASFMVLIGSNISMKRKDIHGTHRVAETSDKDVLILKVHYPNNYDETMFLEQLTLHHFSISELIIKRFNYKKVVNKKNKMKFK